MQASDIPTISTTSKHELPPDSQSPSPTAPPYSPITPIMSNSLPIPSGSATTEQHPYPYTPPVDPESHNTATLTQNAQHILTQPAPQQEPELQPPPPPQPISMSDNPDAIALRAAMSILQIQRQQALRDMKTLEKQKEKALEDPEIFARNVSEGKIKARGMEGIIPRPNDQLSTEEDGDPGDSDNELDGVDIEAGRKSNSFGDIPSAQNVVRMPPVNWAKYHIIGESLDKLHNEQRARPNPGYPLRDEDLRPRERAPESTIAAPYNPWVDKVGEKQERTRNLVKKSG